VTAHPTRRSPSRCRADEKSRCRRHRLFLEDRLAPQGKLALIDDPETLDIVPFKRKSLSVHWELMFTRSL
jgi:hypothetical protein